MQKVTPDASLAIINVVLLLIFFFLITGQFIADNAGAMDIAVTTELPFDQLPRPILVIGPGGELELDGVPVAPELLRVAVEALPRPVTLNVLIDRSAPAQTLLTLLDRPELAEFEMRLVTLREMDPT
ncbi:MAG: biopolymer transporter ExbD [Rubellimicrobium sp.]|nr:biopolymer transporter ExbD [Rubellimicrobium sp.]